MKWRRGGRLKRRPFIGAASSLKPRQRKSETGHESADDAAAFYNPTLIKAQSGDVTPEHIDPINFLDALGRSGTLWDVGLLEVLPTLVLNEIVDSAMTSHLGLLQMVLWSSSDSSRFLEMVERTAQH